MLPLKGKSMRKYENEDIRLTGVLRGLKKDINTLMKIKLNFVSPITFSEAYNSACFDILEIIKHVEKNLKMANVPGKNTE